MTIDLSALSLGSHTLKVSAVHNNVEISKSVTFSIASSGGGEDGGGSDGGRGGGGGGGGGAAPVTTTTTSIGVTSSTSTIPAVVTTTTSSIEPPAPETTTTTSIEEAKCPLQQTLGEDAVELDVLRAFRDQRLANSATGLSLIYMYYAHGREISAILAENPDLMCQTRLLVLELLPLINNANITGEKIELTASQHRKIDTLMNMVQGKSSAKLAASITYILMKLESGELINDLN
jgi:hypothetical protein